jgi:ABC-type glycerol-3-phosphate transport system permease component
MIARLRPGSGKTRALVLVIIGVGLMFPLYWMVVVALTPFGFSRAAGSSLIPSTITLDNFTFIFTERPMLRWLVNSALVAFSAASVSVAVGATAGYALSRLRFSGATVILVVILITQMLPQTTIVIPLYAVFRDLGLLNSLTAVSLAHMTIVIPIAVWLSKGFFDSIPSDLESAARVDGSSRFGAFWRVALPLAAPGLAAIFVYGFVVSWHEFLFARTLASPQELWTASVGLASFRGEYVSQSEPQMAAALVFALPVVVVFLVLQRQFVAGLAAGGVK